jgi:hypothetical protein
MNPAFANGKVFGLRWWQALIVFSIASLLGMFSVVAMREGLGWPVPEWVGGGLGGLFGVFGVTAVSVIAQKRRAKLVRAGEPVRPQS